MIHLDTGFLIRALTRGSPEGRRLRAWLREATSVGISAVSWAEFLCGPVEAADVALAARIVGDPVEFTGDDSAGTARLFNLAGRRRGSFTDCMIAAVALPVGASLATTNPDDFGRFDAVGLEIVRA